MQKKDRMSAEEILQDIHVSLGGYIKSLVILSVLTSIIYLIFFSVVRLPYAVLLSLLAAPLGAWAAKHFPAKQMLILVGIVLTLTSAYGVYTAWA